jgi:4-hydroxythreonine-4-phosphate dehydrogenase
VALTLGDPAGIGPEIVARVVRKKSVAESLRLLVVGDSFVLEHFLRHSRLKPPLSRYCTIEEIHRSKRFPCLLDAGHEPFAIPVGQVDARCGQLSIDYVQTAIRLALAKTVDGIVTAPIHKQAWAAAGSPFPGHTEMLADLSATRNYAMAFWAKGFLTVLMSTHLSLRGALARLSQDLLSRTLHLTITSLREFGLRKARIAVAGVNPHAGEGGLLGDEENRIFLPVIQEFQLKKFNVSGPYSADTLYLRAAAGEFDAVIAPYHDQALLAVKTLSFGHAINITLGLPFVRTSVDHGTAFDIAGRGIASEKALLHAIEKCRDLILRRKKRYSH